jgi:hypothetical protein
VAAAEVGEAAALQFGKGHLWRVVVARITRARHAREALPEGLLGEAVPECEGAAVDKEGGVEHRLDREAGEGGEEGRTHQTAVGRLTPRVAPAHRYAVDAGVVVVAHEGDEGDLLRKVLHKTEGLDRGVAAAEEVAEVHDGVDTAEEPRECRFLPQDDDTGEGLRVGMDIGKDKDSHTSDLPHLPFKCAAHRSDGNYVVAWV